MAQEPQRPNPMPLRLQAEYQRLRLEMRNLRDKVRAGDKNQSEALDAKEAEIIDFVIAHKDSL